ncbi:MAG: non-lysosomal glucosylceramidase, partial [Clostridia bacterium]|nr:non-lysosomal glucosylceramidase [Clostridia bacterium]
MFYDKKHTKEIIFPLGGIGSGCIGLCGNGRLREFEIFNRPNKCSENGFTHLAIRAETKDGVKVKVLNGDAEKDFIGQYTNGYGTGISPQSMAGFDHFENHSFEGNFPIAKVNLTDENYPADVTVTAFNPFIPNDAFNSSIPLAFFEIEIKNKSEEKIKYTTAFTFQNPFKKSRNALLSDKTGVFMQNADADENDAEYGDMTLSAYGGEIISVVDWFRGNWQDGITTYWNEITSPAGLNERRYDTDGEKDHCTVAVSAYADGKSSVKVGFVLTWNVPNFVNYWDKVAEGEKFPQWKNYYATVWKNSAESNAYARANRESLFKRTIAFTEALHGITVDPAIEDAASSTLSVLHSPTVFRLEDGSFYGWEGSFEHQGSCEGTCTHVWNYAYALCYLFPELERSIRDLDFKYNLRPNGAMRFRLKLPPRKEGGWDVPCVDGQAGGIIKLYRDWKLSGNDDWLKEKWVNAKKSLDFFFDKNNPFLWDKDGNGVLYGRQHHTLDMEL